MILAAIVVFLVGGFFVINNGQRTITEVEETHLHAGFQVYINNELQDYSGFEYMKISPCFGGEHQTDLTPEEEQLEKAHLHDNIGDVVHVHRKGATWGDLFQNANINIEENITAYVNDQQVESIFNMEIEPYDSVVIFQGENDDLEEKLTGRVSRDRIVEAENMSENCGS